MEVIDPGHQYRLNVLDGTEKVVLTFVKREGGGYPGNVGSYPGTICQEVLRALLDRLNYLNGQIPCWQNRLAYHCLLIGLWAFEHRHAMRKGRFLWISPWHLDRERICPQCEHVRCQEHVK